MQGRAISTARPAKVAVIGAGRVGSAVANALVLLRTCATVVLYNRTLALAEGEAWDIGDTTPLLHGVDVVATDTYTDVAGADVIVITVGGSIPKGGTRLDALGANAGLMRTVMAELDRVAPEAVVVVVSNPVDVLTRVAMDASARAEHLVMGSGTVLDTARVRYQLAKDAGVAPQDAHVHVIGEHGDSEIVVWSSAAIGGVPLAQYPLPDGLTPESLHAACMESTRRRGYTIFERKGYTNYGIAVAVREIVDSVLRDEKRVLSVSTRAPAGYGIGTEVVLGLPSVVGKDGVERTLVLPRNDEEQRLLERSAAILAGAYRMV